MISSEINDLPLESRLDALLSRINDAEQDANSEDEFDYADFARKRAEEARSTQPPVASSNSLAPAIPLSDDLDDYDLIEAGSPNPSQVLLDEDTLESPATPRLSRVLSSPNAASSSPLANGAAQDSPVHSPVTSPRVVSSPMLASSPQRALPQTSPQPSQADRDSELLKEIYAEAGVAPQSPTNSADETLTETRRRPTRKAAEAAARENQRLERALELEVGTHTVASASVDSFLAMLDDPSDPPSSTTPATSPQTPYHNNASKQVMLSSPPSARRLASFVRPIAPINTADDDSDLEIVPQTAKARRSRPVRALLSFARPNEANAASKANAASNPVRRLFADLQTKQRQQILSSRMAKVQQLQAMGIDVSEETKAAAEAPSEETKESYLERERRLADELRKREKREERGDMFGFMDSDSDAESASDIEPAADAAAKADPEAEDAVMDDDEESIHSASEAEYSGSDSDLEVLDVEVSRRQLIDSDEDEPEELEPEDQEDEDQEDEDEEEVLATQAVAQPTQLVEPPLFPALRRAEPQATQVLAELPSDRLRALLGGESVDDPGSYKDTDVEVEAEEPSLVDEIDISDGGSDLSDHVVAPKHAPDLSDLKDAQLSRSQEMREVRQRYLQAQEKEFVAPFVDDQAEESEDEWAGMGGRSDDDEGHDDGRDLQGLVNDTDIANNKSKVWQLYNQQERDRDEVEINRLVDDVHNGFRRRRGDNGLLDGLSDSESDGERRKAREARRAREKRKRAKMLEGSTEVAKLAANEKTMAFVESIAADLIKPEPAVQERATAMSVHESLRFLSEPAEPEVHENIDIGGDAGEDDGLPRTTLSIRSVRKVVSTFGQGQTYASRVAAAEKGVQSVEVLKSLGAPARAPKAKRARILAAPMARKPTQTTTSIPQAGSLFRRQWQ